MKKFRVYSEERFDEGFEIEAENFKEADEKVLDLIDIHEVDENGEIID